MALNPIYTVPIMFWCFTSVNSFEPHNCPRYHKSCCTDGEAKAQRG